MFVYLQISATENFFCRDCEIMYWLFELKSFEVIKSLHGPGQFDPLASTCTSSAVAGDGAGELAVRIIVALVALDLEVQTDVDQAEKEDDNPGNEAVELAKRDHTHANE